jgi:hypothetical protein
MFRTLAAAATILAAPALTPAAEPTAAEKKVIAQVTKLGGKAEIDEKLDESARVAVTLPKGTDATLAAVARLPAVGSVTVEDASKCTDRGVGTLKALPKLKKLVLAKSAATDRTAAAIGSVKSLEALYLGDSKLTDAGLAPLKKLPDLRSLDVMDAKVTDKGLAHLAECAKLEELNLSGTRVTDAGLPHLAKLTGLKTVRLNRTDVTREGVEKLQEALPKAAVRY